MEYNNILVNIEDGILTITVNREDKLNALNKQTIAEIGKAVESGNADSSVSGMIITGAGKKAFVAGADISEFSSFSIAEGKALSAHGHDVFNSIENSQKVVIAAINGFALGGGCELAMSCHMRIASENAKFGQPEVKLGLIPGYAGTQRLIQLAGKGKAIELLTTADMIGAEEAHRIGLVNHVVAQDELLGKCKEILTKIASVSPMAVTAVIDCVNAYFEPGKPGFNKEIEEFGNSFGTPDFKEGTTAFLEKRKPEFKRN